MLPKFIVMTCKNREHWVEELKSQIPNLEISFDNFTDAGKFKNTSYKNFQQALQMAGDDACVQLEDDIILCNDFYNKILKSISERLDEVIQFFSMRKKDLTIGSRYESGGNFLMHQCFYLPKGMAKKLFDYSFEFEDMCKQDEHISPNDLVTQYYFKEQKIKYWIHIPNLVDHKIAKSMIDKRRSSKRQSFTFKD